MSDEVRILDCTLRDGSYVIDFQFTAEDTALLCSALDSAGIDLIEVGHGLGLGASRSGKGVQPCTDEAYLRAAASVVKQAEIAVFFIPGIGTEEDLRLAAGCGVNLIRIGTNITDFADQVPFIHAAKRLGLNVSTNLMKSYAVPADVFADLARQAGNEGADVVCLVDSAGGMLPEDVRHYIETACIATDAAIGFHGHDNLSLAVANTLEACAAGATVLDTSLKGMGRSEGNAVTEVLTAILQKRGLLLDVDVNGLLDISEAYVAPLLHEPRRSSLGITAGRAKFHSSFTGRLLSAATRYGVDVRDLILRVCQRDTIDAPEELVNRLAQELAEEEPKSRVRVDFASASAEAPQGFAEQVADRARELKEKSRKLSLPSVFNIVVTPYEMTQVSPYVETRYGCAMSNIMLAEGERLAGVLNQIDGLVDYVLLDNGDSALGERPLVQSTLLTYSDHAMWASATVSHVTALLDKRLDGKILALTGTPRLVLRAAADFAEAGARVLLDDSLRKDMESFAQLSSAMEWSPLNEAVSEAHAVVSLSPRRPAVDAALVAHMRPDALLYDGGIGSLDRDAVPEAESRGIRVVRVDMRPALAAAALERIGTLRIVNEHMGRATWNGIDVVAGGLIGREGEVIVDSVSAPTRVIGIADGKGGVLRPDPSDDQVLSIRRAIAERQLGIAADAAKA